MTAIRLLTTAVLLLLCQAPLQAQLNAIDPLTSTTGNRVGDNLGASLESRLENGAGNGIGNSTPNNRQSSLNSPEVIAPIAFLAVDQAYILNVEGPADDGTVRINWQIASDYYLYRHNLKFQLLDDNNNTSSIEAIIPAGLAKEDEYFGKVEVYYHNLDVMLNELPSNDTLTLAITYQGCADAGLCYPPQTRFYKLDSNGARALTAGPDSTPAAAITPSKPATSVPLMMLLALIGGAILNLMPCVFPVLSLKVLSFANNSEQSQGTHGLVYSAGVILSFVAVAAVLISLQSAGEAIGWGFQLQSPWFVAGLCYLFFTLGLSLSGLIEFGGQWMNTGNKLASQSGYSGSFFTGTLAAVVASPCTAPLMGTALGFAATQPAAIALSVFAALGLGMALPVLILSYSPKLLATIPKPGPWMETLKQFLAFPLYATAVWLSWIVGNQTGVNGMALLLLGCVGIALALWLWALRSKLWRTVSLALAILALSALASPLLDTAASATEQKNWQRYSPATLDQLRNEGRAVFVNITADWCITCLANERVALATETVEQALLDTGVVYLKGDWTNPDAEIAALIKSQGRNSIPLYLLYHANSDQVEVLPQFLTSGLLVEAFNRAQ